MTHSTKNCHVGFCVRHNDLCVTGALFHFMFHVFRFFRFDVGLLCFCVILDKAIHLTCTEAKSPSCMYSNGNYLHLVHAFLLWVVVIFIFWINRQSLCSRLSVFQPEASVFPEKTFIPCYAQDIIVALQILEVLMQILSYVCYSLPWMATIEVREQSLFALQPWWGSLFSQRHVAQG